MSFIDPLLALQDVDMQIWHLEQEQKELPKRKKDEEVRLANAARRQVEFEASPEATLDASAKAELEAEVADISAYIAEIADHILSIAAEIADLTQQRTELAKNVRPEHLLIYDRLRVSRHPTIVKLQNGTCGGCHLGQPPSVAHLIRRDNQLVTCEMCGRILY